MYLSQNMLVRVSLKIANCTPDQLPPDLHARLTELMTWANATLVQGFLRPGGWLAGWGAGCRASFARVGGWLGGGVQGLPAHLVAGWGGGAHIMCSHRVLTWPFRKGL